MASSVIMAGGFGKRLWPQSRINHPKQFLNLGGKESLLQSTYKRCIKIFGVDNTFIVTRGELKEKILSHLPSIPEENLIIEPAGKDTAACIGLSAIYLQKKEKDNFPMIVMPSDHLIEGEKEFSRVINAAVKSAEEGYLVAVGIRPTRAETGYGYIQLGEKIGEHDGVPCYRLKRFTEKPSQKKAKSFLESGDFLWNAGIFGWLPHVILEEIRNYLPPLWNGLEKIKGFLGTAREKEVIESVYPELPKISIDYAVMEKTQKAVVIPAQFYWDDIGEWKAVERIFSRNQNGNIIRGAVKEIDTNNCIFINSEDKVLGAIGLSNIIVVNCEAGVLVVNKELSPRVKELVDELLKDDKFKK